MRLAGAEAEATEENPDRDDTPAQGADKKRRLELGFCARCDHRRPDVSLLDRER
jgi:hypothetical protein